MSGRPDGRGHDELQGAKKRPDIRRPFKELGKRYGKRN